MFTHPKSLFSIPPEEAAHPHKSGPRSYATRIQKAICSYLTSWMTGMFVFIVPQLHLSGDALNNLCWWRPRCVFWSSKDLTEALKLWAAHLIKHFGSRRGVGPTSALMWVVWSCWLLVFGAESLSECAHFLCKKMTPGVKGDCGWCCSYF